MKQGKTLQELAAEIKRQSENKRDFVADTRDMFMELIDGQTSGHHIRIGRGEDSPSFPLTDHCHQQMASRLGIPYKYYKRMLTDAGDLLTRNVNHWFDEAHERRMFRTLDGYGRAFVSDRYQRIDNDHLSRVLLPILGELGDVEFVSNEITPNRMYIKVVTPRVTGEVGVGDPVQAGVVISNSEVGKGSVKVEPMVYRLVCRNGMIAGRAMRKYHVGARIEEDGELSDIFADDTRKADDEALLLKLRDVTRAAVSQTHFDETVNKLREAKGEPVERPVKAVEELTNQFSLSSTESEDVLTHLIHGGDLSRYGMLNAVTRASQDVEDYDRATELEQMGGQILSMPTKAWTEIAQAA